MRSRINPVKIRMYFYLFLIHQDIIYNILLYLLKELFDAMEKKPIKKVPIEEIPKGPGVCEVRFPNIFFNC